MKRLALVCLTLIMLPGLAQAAFQVPDYQPLAVAAEAPAYTVKPDLSNVANRAQFGKFTERQKELLARNSFFVSPADDKQLYFVYEKNDYLVIPNFIASDAVLQLYHILYDYSLREVEAERLIPLCRKLTQHMLSQSLSTYRHLPPGNVRDAAVRNVAYFGVAARALGLRVSLPREAGQMVKKEWQTISAHKGREPSAIFPYKFDFSQFVPRGHYTRSEKLKRYFRAMMWYGLVPLGLDMPPPDEPAITYEQIRQSLLMTRALYETKLNGKPAIETWQRIYEPTAFYVETADDLTPAEWREAAVKVWGHLPGPEELEGEAKLTEFHDLAKEIRAPRIATFEKTGIFEQIWYIPSGPQFRFMGQRSIPDSYMLQQLVWSNVGTLDYQRRMPKGLDVFAVLGSERGYEHLKEIGESKYAHYDEQIAKLRGEFSAREDQEWRRNLYWGWVWTLKGLTQPVGPGYPSFMLNDAWLDKELSSALASWAELRHDTILYAKQSVTAECGDGGEEELPPPPKGYVEPTPEVYHRMLWLTQATREGLRARDLLTQPLGESFGRMEDLLTFLERVSLKELANEPLKPAEYDQICVLGAELERLTNMVTTAIGGKTGELLSEADEDMAVIADVHSDLYKKECLEEAVGHANHIFVVVPIQGKLYLTRGAVFSYYEFSHPISDRLTDEKWQEMLESKQAPEPPYWTSNFLADEKSQLPTPERARTEHRPSRGC